MKKAQKMLAMLGMAVFMLLVPMQVNAEEEEPIVIEQSTQFGNAQSLELGKTYSYYTKMKQNNRNVYVALELEEDSVQSGCADGYHMLNRLFDKIGKRIRTNINMV